jgi:glyoxylase-like metal-dependent hydrolase (beta-lactamase superfamily II)
MIVPDRVEIDDGRGKGAMANDKQAGDDRSEQETPHPPQTAEFAHVTPGGPAHVYPEVLDGVRVTKFSVGAYDNNVYVIASDGEAIVIDGAAEPERILAETDGLRVVEIVETHGHFDHVQALPELIERLGAPVLAHPGDTWPVPTQPIAGGETRTAGRAVLGVLHTPGHTPGSTTYALLGSDGTPVQLFTGDTLFPGGPGNTRSDAGSFDQVMQSVEVLFEFGDDVVVSPGHGLDTTLGRERPYVEVWRRRGW